MKRRFRILIVEDSPLDRKLMAHALLAEEPSLLIETAYDGQNALEHISSKRPNLILFDLHMPRMDGISFLTQLKTDPDFRTIPAVAFTGSTDPEDIRQCYAAYANAFIPKPENVDAHRRIAKALVEFWVHSAAMAA